MRRVLVVAVALAAGCAGADEEAAPVADASDAGGGWTPFTPGGGRFPGGGEGGRDAGGDPDAVVIGGRKPGGDAGGTADGGGGPGDIATDDTGMTADGGADAGGGVDAAPVDAGKGDDAGAPIPFTYSWDGSWTPAPGDFPLPGLLDDEYNDGHTNWDGTETAILPPGDWDWNDANDDYANYRNFEETIGTFEKLVDPSGNHYGWTVKGNAPGAIDFHGPAAYWHGTPGVERLNLGPAGLLHSYTTGNLGDGPDELVLEGAWSLDFRTGSSESGATNDNDRVVAGCGEQPDASYPIFSCSIHTGPGRDVVFVRDMKGAAIDLGNGLHGRTDAIDPDDGDDVAVLRGNMRDFRVFGGAGDDTVFWYVDEGKESIAFFGPNFFGGGGAGDAIFAEAGTDRLIFVIPTDTEIVQSFQGPTTPGQLRVWTLADYKGAPWWDEPVYDDPYARYCITCGIGPGGRRTTSFEYVSKNGVVHTGYFWVTGFEEIQIGLGAGAKVYALDEVAAKLSPLAGATVAEPPPFPEGVCE